MILNWIGGPGHHSEGAFTSSDDAQLECCELKMLHSGVAVRHRRPAFFLHLAQLTLLGIPLSGHCPARKALVRRVLTPIVWVPRRGVIVRVSGHDGRGKRC